MTQTLVVPTQYQDLGELAEGLAERVESDQLILFGPTPFDEDAEVTFQVLLGDESIALEGRGRAVASVDGGEERDDEYRYDIVIHALELSDRFMAVYDRILLLTSEGPATNEHAVVDFDAVEEVTHDGSPLDGSGSDRIDQTTEFGAEDDALSGRTESIPASSQAPVSQAPVSQAPSHAPSDTIGEEEQPSEAVVDGLVDEISVADATPEDLVESSAGAEIYEQPRMSSQPPPFSSRPPSAPPLRSSRPPAISDISQLQAGERDLYPEPAAPQKPAAPQVSQLGGGLSRPSSAQAYSLEPEDEETLYPASTGLFQYAKGELPAPQAPARPREHSFRPVQPAPSLAPVAPRGSNQGFAENLPSLRPIALGDIELYAHSAPPPSSMDAEPMEAETYAGDDIESVPADALAVESLSPEADPSEVTADDVVDDDAVDFEGEPVNDVANGSSESMSTESLPPDAISGDSLSPESPKRDA